MIVALEVAIMRKILSLIFKTIVIIATVYGLFLNFQKSGFSRMVVYFTILSNIAILVFFIVQLIYDIFGFKKSSKFYIIKLILLINITITMFAFEFVVRPYINMQTGYTAMNIRDTFVHVVVPVLTILDYIVFDEKGNFNFEYIKYAVISPILYLIFVTVYGNFGGRFTAFGNVSKYPYIFMDFDSLGKFAIIGCIIAILAFLGTAWLIVFIDGHFSKKPKKREL